MARLLLKTSPTHHFKTSDLEKLSNELKKHDRHCTPEELNIILENHWKLLKSLDINVLDDYQVIMYFLNGIGIYSDYCETWELFFEPLGTLKNKMNGDNGITLFHTFFEIHIDLNLSIKTTVNIILIIRRKGN